MKPNLLRAATLLFSLALVHVAMAAQPVITSPIPGSTLTSSSTNFQWTSGPGVAAYYLSAGSVTGASDLYSTNAGLGLSATVTNLPTNGMTLHVRLSWLTAGGWQSGDYTYTMAGTNTPVPNMISPQPGSTLSSTSATFQWTYCAGATKYYLAVGSAPGATNIYYRNQNLNTSATVTGLPTNGMTLYARLWWQTVGGWQSGDYTYMMAGTNTPLPEMVGPPPGSTLSPSSATFHWTYGVGVTKYYLAVGSTPGANNIYYQNQNLNSSATVSGLPTNGMTLYVRLWWLVSTAWQSADYTYETLATLGAVRQGTNIVISWPTNDPAFWLEYATNLPASTWISNSVAPVIQNGRYTVTNAVSDPFVIYRLEK
ncbi:MAG TPA: hypothetical protein VFY06_04680 [Verrucomicrobiae bacterium]|nr:hypothetical protein [Verrucomicrobiae bacterium]